MVKIKWIFGFLLLFTGKHIFSQTQQWSQLVIPVPEGWSTNNHQGTIKYSNYNLKPEHPMSILFFPPQPFSGRPDTLFAFAWQSLIEKDTYPDSIPRWRRFYTEDGILMQQGGLESGDKESPVFRQLNIYVLDSTFQACLLETNGAKTYRQIQNEWQERLLTVKKVRSKRK